ncbi:MAG: putative DNA-binding domain-containing protein [Deltaproteobacteria bacterium]|nr:putative DNA-binding domain-containing protein [Deltaproteobacteria bacterium]
MKTAKKEKLHKLLLSFDRGIRDYPHRLRPELFQTPMRGDWEDRFSIYGTGYSVRTKEAMEEIFEFLSSAMKVKGWNQWGRAYIEKYPSRVYNLSKIGEDFPKFLKRNKKLIWAEMARFELLIAKSFHAFNRGEKISAERFSEINERSKFEFASSTFLFESKWPIANAWKSQKAKLPSKPKNEFALIYRKSDQVFVRILSANEFKILKSFKARKNLASSLKNLDKNFEPSQLSEWLHFWLTNDFFADFSS